MALILALPIAAAGGTERSAAEEILAGAIEYHDPQGVWGRRPVDIDVLSTYAPILAARIGYHQRNDEVHFDREAGIFQYRSHRGEHFVEVRGHQGNLFLTVDGVDDPDPALAEQLRLQPDRLPRLRDYMTYLYGLPMKLEDAGTNLAPEIREERFQDRDVLALRVTYEPEVGADTWYFYFDPSSNALVGYRFFHDEAAGDGEYIVLEGESVDEGTGLRLPRQRSWYMNVDDSFLGVDEIQSLRVSEP